MKVKISSKGQIVIPKDIRDKLGLRPGTSISLEIIEGKKAVLQPPAEPPEEVFVKAGDRLVEEVLEESRKLDETKITKMLKALGVKD